jgi:hypothetical protein
VSQPRPLLPTAILVAALGLPFAGWLLFKAIDPASLKPLPPLPAYQQKPGAPVHAPAMAPRDAAPTPTPVASYIDGRLQIARAALLDASSPDAGSAAISEVASSEAGLGLDLASKASEPQTALGGMTDISLRAEPASTPGLSLIPSAQAAETPPAPPPAAPIVVSASDYAAPERAQAAAVRAVAAAFAKAMKASPPPQGPVEAIGLWERQALAASGLSAERFSAQAPSEFTYSLAIPGVVSVADVLMRLERIDGHWMLHAWAPFGLPTTFMGNVAAQAFQWGLPAAPRFDGSMQSLFLPISADTATALASTATPVASGAAATATATVPTGSQPTAVDQQRARQLRAIAEAFAASLRSGAGTPNAGDVSGMGAWEGQALASRGIPANFSAQAPSAFTYTFLAQGAGGVSGSVGSARMRVEQADGAWRLRVWSTDASFDDALRAMAVAAGRWGLPGQPLVNSDVGMSVLTLPLAEVAATAPLASAAPQPASGVAAANVAAAQAAPPSPPPVSADAAWPPAGAVLAQLPAFGAAARPAAAASFAPLLWASAAASAGFSPADSESALAARWQSSLRNVGLIGQGADFQAPLGDAAALRSAAFPRSVFRLRRVPVVGWGIAAQIAPSECQAFLSDLSGKANVQPRDAQNVAAPAACQTRAVSFAFIPFASGRSLTAALSSLSGAVSTQQAATPAQSAPLAKAQPIPSAAQTAAAKPQAGAPGAQPAAQAVAQAKPDGQPAAQAKTETPEQIAAANVASAKSAPPPIPAQQPTTRASLAALKLPSGSESRPAADEGGLAPAPLYWPGQQAAAFPRELYDDHVASDSSSDQASRREHARQRLAWMRQHAGDAGASLFPGLNK